MTASVGMSRTLLTTRMAHANSPTTSEPHHAAPGTYSTCTYAEPTVATNPKNTSTITSPRPRYPYGLGPPVYSHAAAMAATPTSSSHGSTISESTRPATAATPNESNAARFTAPGVASPVAVRRTGPLRSLSVPRTPSE